MSKPSMAVTDAQNWLLGWLKSRGHRVVGYESRLAGTHERRSCSMKRRFATAEAALQLEPHLHVYRCRYCDGFHLTTPGHP